MDISSITSFLDLDLSAHQGNDLPARSPIDGAELTRLRAHTKAQVEAMVGAADLDPPLAVDPGVGPNWLAAK